MPDGVGLREFNLAIDKFVDDAPQKLLIFKQKIMLDALRKLVERTPVGNPSLWKSPAPPGYAGGRARANWQVTEGNPSTGFTETIDADGNTTIADGSGDILAIVNPFGEAWISNNLPYIEELEKGHSGQAPAGMLAVTFAEIQGILK